VAEVEEIVDTQKRNRLRDEREKWGGLGERREMLKGKGSDKVYDVKHVDDIDSDKEESYPLGRIRGVGGGDSDGKTQSGKDKFNYARHEYKPWAKNSKFSNRNGLFPHLQTNLISKSEYEKNKNLHLAQEKTHEKYLKQMKEIGGSDVVENDEDVKNNVETHEITQNMRSEFFDEYGKQIVQKVLKGNAKMKELAQGGGSKGSKEKTDREVEVEKERQVELLDEEVEKYGETDSFLKPYLNKALETEKERIMKGDNSVNGDHDGANDETTPQPDHFLNLKDRIYLKTQHDNNSHKDDHPGYNAIVDLYLERVKNADDELDKRMLKAMVENKDTERDVEGRMFENVFYGHADDVEDNVSQKDGSDSSGNDSANTADDDTSSESESGKKNNKNAPLQLDWMRLLKKTKKELGRNFKIETAKEKREFLEWLEDEVEDTEEEMRAKEEEGEEGKYHSGLRLYLVGEFDY
jgi:hypothetical protein